MGGRCFELFWSYMFSCSITDGTFYPFDTPPIVTVYPRQTAFSAAFARRTTATSEPARFYFPPQEQAWCGVQRRLTDWGRKEEVPTRRLSGESASLKPPPPLPPGAIRKVNSPFNQTSGKAVPRCQLDAAAR